MTQRQKSKWDMLALTANMLQTASPAELDLYPLFKGKLTELAATAVLIDSAGAIQLLHKPSTIANKNDSKAIMATAMLAVARPGRAYAKSIKNKVLEKQLKFNDSKVLKIREQLLIEHAVNVHTFAIGKQTELLAFNCPKVDIETLLLAIENFRRVAMEHNESRLLLKAVTRQIADYFKAADEMTADLDITADTMIGRNDALYADYKFRRKIIGTRTTPKSLTGLISNGAGVPLSNVTVTIDGSDIKGKSASKGHYTFKSLEDGVYVVRFNRPGYKEAISSVTISRGTRSVTNIELREL